MTAFLVRAIRWFLLGIILLVSLGAPALVSFSASAASAVRIAGVSNSPLTSVETCDSPALAAWKGDRLAANNGVCLPQEGSNINYKTPLLDFNLAIDLRLDPGSKITFIFQTPVYHNLELVLTPQQAQVLGTVFTGNAAAPGKPDQLLTAPLVLSAGSFHHFEIRHQNRMLTLTVDRAMLGSAKTGSFHTAPIIQFGRGVAFDNLAVEELPIAPSGNSLADLNPELLKSYIVFRDQDSQLWRIHPDGAGLEKLGQTARGGGISFSLDGQYVAYRSENGGWLVVDMAANAILPAWGKGVEATGVIWTPDRHLIYHLANGPAMQIIEADPATAKPLKNYSIPTKVDETGFLAQSFSSLDCSPTARAFLMVLYGKIANDNVTRYVVYDLDQSKVRVLPGNASPEWSRDGRRIILPGAELDYPSLDLHEVPVAAQKYGNLSPNGQFGTVDAGNFMEKEIVELASHKSFGRTSFSISWAPDNRFVTYSDNGRITVQSVLSGKSILVAAGNEAVWQPNWAMTSAAGLVELVAPTLAIPAANTEVTRAADNQGRAATPATRAAITQTPADVSTRPASAAPSGQYSQPGGLGGLTGLFVVILGLGLILGAGGGFMALRPASLVCPSCLRQNEQKNLFCQYCGSPLAGVQASHFNRRRGFYVRMSLVGLLLSVFSAALLIIVGQQRRQVEVVVNPGSQVTAQSTARQPTQAAVAERTQALPQATNTNQPAQNQACAGLDFSKDDLHQAYLKIKKALKDRFEHPAPTLDLQKANPTQVAEYMLNMFPACGIEKVVFSPDGRLVLMTGSTMGQGNSQTWMVAYDSHTLKPVWSLQRSDAALAHVIWSPDGSRMGFFQGTGLQIIDLASGKNLVLIENSTRATGQCTLTDSTQNLLWLADDTLLRKIFNAIQIINARDGTIIKEIPTDDTRMGTANIESRANMCGYELAWSPRGDAFITTGTWPVYSYDGVGGIREQHYETSQWSVQTGQLIWQQRPPLIAYFKIRWSPDGKRVGFIINGQSLVMMDAASGSQLPAATGIFTFYPEVFWSPDSTQLVGKDKSGAQVVFYNVSNKKILQTAHPNGVSVNLEAWLPDGRLLVRSGGNSGKDFGLWIVSGMDGSWTELDDAQVK